MRDWQLMGLTRSGGGLDRPMQATEYRAPSELVLENDRLTWSWRPKPRQVRPGVGMFDQFVQLADAPAERILAYAQRWGILELCAEHHLPTTHNMRPFVDNGIDYGPAPLCMPASRASDHPFWELVDDWRHFACQARALLRIAARLHDGHTGAREDWGTVYEEWVDVDQWANIDEPHDISHLFWPQGNLAGERRQLAYCLNTWLIWGNVRPEFHWNGGRNATPTITLGGEGLFGALAVQLALTISTTDALALCSSCGTPYIPTRRPRVNERRYCPACRDAKRPQRDAARAYRRRNAQAPAASARSTKAPRTRKQKQQ